MACFFFFFFFFFFCSHPQTYAFQQTAIFEETHPFLETSVFFFFFFKKKNLVHKGVKQQDCGQTIRPHNGRNSPHKDAISRKRAQFQEAYFLAVPLPFSIDDSAHFLSKRHGFTKTDGFISEQKKTCSWKIQDCVSRLKCLHHVSRLAFFLHNWLSARFWGLVAEGDWEIEPRKPTLAAVWPCTLRAASCWCRPSAARAEPPLERRGRGLVI